MPILLEILFERVLQELRLRDFWNTFDKAVTYLLHKCLVEVHSWSVKRGKALSNYLFKIDQKKDYTDFLIALSELDSINIILENQTFICEKCGSFTVPVKSIYPTLKKIGDESAFAEILIEELCEIADFEPWYFEFVDQPDEVVEKFIGDMDDYLAVKKVIQSGEFIIEGNTVCLFPFEECAFVFDSKCSCCNILKF